MYKMEEECNENTCVTFSCHGILYEPFYWYEIKYDFFQSYEDEFVEYEEEAGTNNPMWTLRISKDTTLCFKCAHCIDR